VSVDLSPPTAEAKSSSLIRRLGLESVETELRTNPRARFGLMALVVVLLVAGALRLATHVAAQSADIVNLETKARELRALTGPESEEWRRAREQTSSLVAEARQQLWLEAPVGIAHADFYNWIQRSLTESGITGADVRLGEIRRMGEGSNLVEMRVTIFVNASTGGLVSRDAAFAFLHRISSERRLVLTRSLRLKFTPPIVMETELAAFIKEARPKNAQ
jgi:hypothetical protein